MPSLPRLGLLLVALLSPCLARAGDVVVDRSVENTVREVVYRIYNGGKSPLVVEKAPGVTELSAAIANTLRVRCYRVEGIRITSMTIDGDQAVAEFDVATRKSDRRTPDQWPASLDMMPLRMKLVRRDGQWLASALEFPSDALAAQIAAADPKDRPRILAENAHRISRNLARALAARAASYSNSPDLMKAGPLTELVAEVAALAGDRGAHVSRLITRSVMARMGQNDRETALSMAKEALAIAQETGEIDLQVRAWLNLSQCIGAFDAFDPEVEKAVLQALELAPYAEDPKQMIRILHNLSGAAYLKRDYLTARTYLEQSLPLIRQNRDVVNDIVYDMQTGLIYYDQGDPDLSMHHLERAVALMEQSGKKWVLPIALRMMGAIHEDAGRHEEARESFAKALKIAGPADGETVAGVLSSLALMEADAGRLGEAECMFRQAGETVTKAGYGWGATLHRMAPHLIKAGDFRRALEFSLDDASRMQTKARIAAVAAITWAAEAARRMGRLDQSMALAMEAIQLQEEINARAAGGETQQARVGGNTAETYELAGIIALDQHDDAGALALIENGRGRVLFDIVQGGRPSFDSEAAAADRAHAEEFRRELTRLSVELGRASERDAERLRAELVDLQRDYESYRDGLRARNARRAESERTISASSLDETLRQLPRELAAIEYVVRPERVIAFVIRRDAGGTPEITRHEMPIEKKELEKQVNELVDLLAGNDVRYRRAAKALHALLMAPLERDLRGADVVCIVPDEVLWRVPFAALVDGRDRFVVERHATVYAPSLTVYAAMASRRDERPNGGVLALANPLVDAESKTRLASVFRSVDLGPLEGAEEEAEAICALYGPPCTVLRQREATEARTKEAVRDARLVHFATHGVFDDRNPMYSRLVLSRREGSGEDGSLEAWEIASLDVDADLVVLSACDTARGRIGGGEGVVGMAWSFFVAGARSTLATQWKVASESTADLMIAFHESLRARERETSLRKARALRDAQLRTLRQSAKRHPFYWAAFVILGDAS